MRYVSIVWIAVVVALMPLQATLSRRKVKAAQPTRMRAYTSTIFGLILMGGITLWVDLFSGGTGVQAATNVLTSQAMGLWTGGTVVACAAAWFGGMWQRKLWRQPADEVVALLLPRTARERSVFLVVSLVAGTVEEYVMRGFCLLGLAQATGSVMLSFALVTVSFGIAHGYQGAWAMLRTGLLGAILAIPVIYTGTLLPSVAAHVVTDMLAGAFGYRLLRHWNLLEKVRP